MGYYAKKSEQLHRMDIMGNNQLDTQLDPELIKDYMDKAKLNRTDMALVLGKRQNGLTEKELKNLAKKWSRLMNREEDSYGRLRRADAELIAKFISEKLGEGVEVSDLQHPNLPDRKAKLVELMKCAVKKMEEENKKDGLDRIAKELGFEPDVSPREWDAASYADLSDKIEWLHLFGETGELESFAKLFDITAQQLRPVPLASFWLFSSSNPFCNSHSLGKLVAGHDGVLAEIEENWKALPDWVCNHPERIKATVSEEVKEKRYRLRFETSSTLTFSCLFYACDTKEKTGLPAKKASKWELEKLMTHLKYFLFDHVDTVVINGVQFPPENVSGVFQVRFFDERDNNETVELGQRIYNHRLPLHYSLQTLLEKQDADHLVSPIIPMTALCFPGILMWLYENQRKSKYYEISFGWLGDEGEFHEGPWPIILREQFIKELEGKPILNLHGISTLPESDETPPFEPEQQSPASEGVVA